MVQNQLVVTLLLVFAGMCSTELELLSVSSSPQVVQHPVFSSLQGHRRVYLDIIGHNQDADKLKIMAGAYPCEIIDKGVTPTSITCTTTKADSSANGEYQYILVTSDGKTINSTYPNVVVYSSGSTPTLKECSKSSSKASKLVEC